MPKRSVAGKKMNTGRTQIDNEISQVLIISRCITPLANRKPNEWAYRLHVLFKPAVRIGAGEKITFAFGVFFQ